MAHQIDTMAYTGQRPWHGLGTHVVGAMTAEEAIQAGGLGWTVEKKPIYYKDGSVYQPVQDTFATVRSDTGRALGVVSDIYTPLQNRDAFSFFDAMIKEKLAIYHTVGSLKDGRRVWLLAKLPKVLRVAGKDAIELYTLLANSHDGKGSVELMNTPVRVVCNNTLSRARKAGSDRFFVRHTKNMSTAIDDAREALGIINRDADAFLDEANRLVKSRLTREAVDGLLASVGLAKLTTGDAIIRERREDTRLTVMALMEKGKGNDAPGVRGTLWAGYNGITEWIDHVWQARSADSRLERTWFGRGAALKAAAHGAALQLAK